MFAGSVTKNFMETLTPLLLNSGPIRLLLGVSYAGAYYQKQFEPLPGNVLWEALAFIGSCLLLAVLAAWLISGETRDVRIQKGRESEPAGTSRKRRKRRAKL